MTDFVLEQKETQEYLADFEKVVVKYANFLKRPLELGFFIACDEDGNVLEEAIGADFMSNYDMDLFLAYQQARNSVLFEGFKLSGKNIIESNWYKLIFYHFSNGNKQYRMIDLSDEKLDTKEVFKIEDLANFNFKPTLTPSAIKEIGL